MINNAHRSADFRNLYSLYYNSNTPKNTAKKQPYQLWPLLIDTIFKSGELTEKELTLRDKIRKAWQN